LEKSTPLNYSKQPSWELGIIMHEICGGTSAQNRLKIVLKPSRYFIRYIVGVTQAMRLHD